MDNLFAPVDGTWQGVSPRLATVRRILIVSLAAGVALVGLVLALVPGLAAWIQVSGWVLVAASVAGGGWGWRWARRNQRSWGYTENADDLLVTRGVMFKRLVAIPYGRMQFVDVQAGPLERAFGIATVTLHTASPETAAQVPGLDAAEATRLRNRLTELGEAHGAGL
ncbi:PH domain-containing protein [Aeromicrobium stalagmiti]|uniref:PH domain-containing protein n=1 Tax=Aeromicrobium stalagmiti TaxID=2738988 RepID=UPI0015683002|nr:PH domain-containing protein [Aeromicrobium stalagmiti]NRQ50218.1 PH domain-containing protein [Aeromicrobium stalagmiti]